MSKLVYKKANWKEDKGTCLSLDNLWDLVLATVLMAVAKDFDLDSRIARSVFDGLIFFFSFSS